jgi:hypothetical protein
MKISDLKIECDDRTCVTVWVKCQSPEEIDNLIAWLQLAKSVMLKWEKINANASRPSKATASKDEAS